MKLKENLSGLLVQGLPKKVLSHYTGKLVHKKLPGFMGKASVKSFAKYYNINMDEAEHSIEHYKTIGDLFTRKLKAGARPLGSEPVHPADGRLTEYGKIDGARLFQAKGKSYSLNQFLGNEEMGERYLGGSFYTYYLCPTDYHRVHSPVSGRIGKLVHIPGQLWPVNDWSVNKIQDLFAINERVLVEIETPQGPVAAVFVGATNVGKITVSFDAFVSSNIPGQTENVVKTYKPKIEIKAGDELGTFHMGSTVVVLYSKNYHLNWSRPVGEAVKVNSSLNQA